MLISFLGAPDDFILRSILFYCLPNLLELKLTVTEHQRT